MLLLLACTTSEPETPDEVPESPEAAEAPAADGVKTQLSEICRVDGMGLGRAPDPGELVEVDRAATGIPHDALRVRVTSAWVEVDGEQLPVQEVGEALLAHHEALEEARSALPDAVDEDKEMPRPVANVFVSREVMPQDLVPVLDELSKHYDARFVARTTEKSPAPADWMTYEAVLTDMERGDGPEAISRAVQGATARCPDVAEALNQASIRRDCTHLQTALPDALDACGSKVDTDVVLTLLHVSLLPPADSPLLSGWEVPLDCTEGAARVELNEAWDTGFQGALEREGTPTCFTAG